MRGNACNTECGDCSLVTHSVELGKGSDSPPWRMRSVCRRHSTRCIKSSHRSSSLWICCNVQCSTVQNLREERGTVKFERREGFELEEASSVLISLSPGVDGRKRTMMDITLCILMISSLVDIAQAVKCHDCSSWNPYCREKVDEPFESAVAVVECEKTSTCFLKKDESGVINRGCADWWMESQVDINYVGCQTQHVPWLGEMTWCFCKKDYCNGGSIDMISKGIFPEVKESKKTEWGDYDEHWDDSKWTENHAEKEEGSEKESETETETDTETESKAESEKKGSADDGKGKTFDDINPGYLGSSDPRKNADPKYQLWFWHADSDRPHWEEDDNGWRAPDWVEKDDGEGWDFPVTGKVHKHGEESAEHSTAPNQVAGAEEETTVKESTTWNWGNGWAHIKPWWLKDDYDENKSTDKPRRWTHPTRAPRFQDDGWAGLPSKWGQGQREREGGQNSVEDVEQNTDYDINNNNNNAVDLNKQDFFCWDCYSDSPLCRDTVDIVKAAYLGKTSCSTTNKCFVRKDKGVVYRGCTDGWTSSVIDTNYVGCKIQQMWGRTVEWCFCTASLCNGDSMQSIKEKYMAPAFEPFKVTKSLEEVNLTTSAPLSTDSSNSPLPFKAKTTAARSVQKRSTTTANADNSTVSVDFHVETDTQLPSSPSTDKSSPADTNAEATTSAEDWLTTDDQRKSTATGSGQEDEKSGSENLNGMNYRALVG